MLMYKTEKKTEKKTRPVVWTDSAAGVIIRKKESPEG